MIHFELKCPQSGSRLFVRLSSRGHLEDPLTAEQKVSAARGGGESQGLFKSFIDMDPLQGDGKRVCVCVCVRKGEDEEMLASAQVSGQRAERFCRLVGSQERTQNSSKSAGLRPS